MTWFGEIPFKELGMTDEKFSLLKDLALSSDYYQKALEFIKGVSTRKPSSLSLRQRNWLTEIIASLEDKLNKKEAEQLFTEDENRRAKLFFDAQYPSKRRRTWRY